MIVTSASGPYPRQDREPRMIMTIPIRIVHTVRLMWNSSAKVATALSVSAIALVSAANRTSAKKTMPMMEPNPILANILGMVMNIREGPAPSAWGSPPEKAKTAGMIIRPASMAIPVSKISTCIVDSSILTSFFI